MVKWSSRILLAISAGLATAFAVAWFGGETAWIPPTLSGAFLALAVAAATLAGLKRWSFTIWIATAVVVGMAYPDWFLEYRGFKYTSLFVPILQIIMFCMGTTLSAGSFLRVLRMPWGVLIGLVCQFSIMPLLGYTLAIGFGLPPEIGAGVILVGTSPSGLASNVMAFVAKADVAMSVTLTACATLLAPLLTPLLMELLAGQMIPIDTKKMMWNITRMVLIPVLGGLAFHHAFYRGGAWLDRVMPALSMLGIFIMTVLTVATGRDKLLQLGLTLILVCFLHSSAGYMLGYLACRGLRLAPNTCRTIALEVGMQNSGMAAGIAATMGRVGTLGLAPILFGPIMNTTASVLANWWRTHPVESPADHGT